MIKIEVNMEKTLKALGDPVRREILKLLKQGTMNVGQIARHFSISDATQIGRAHV